MSSSAIAHVGTRVDFSTLLPKWLRIFISSVFVRSYTERMPYTLCMRGNKRTIDRMRVEAVLREDLERRKMPNAGEFILHSFEVRDVSLVQRRLYDGGAYDNSEQSIVEVWMSRKQE